MAQNPINLGVRFLLEVIVLIVLGSWGWQLAVGGVRFLLAGAVPMLAAVIWGIFAVPEDPSRSGKAPVPVPGWIRLLLELGFFGAAVWVLQWMGKTGLGWIFAGVVLIHYVISYDRILWLFGKDGPGESGRNP